MLKKGLKEYPFDRYGYSEIRVIDDTDFACEGDDPFATVHLLLTSKFDVRAITAEHFSHIPGSAQQSYDKIQQMLEAMELEEPVTVCHGGMPMASETEYEVTEAAEFIVREAQREDDRPLFVVCQGAITNVAIALKLAPEIAKKMHIIWIGGGDYPTGGWEFNLSNDVVAARIVMDSGISLWQVPAKAYSMMRVGLEDLRENIYSCGKIGAWLCRQLWEATYGIEAMRQAGIMPLDRTRPETYAFMANGDQWQLGDSPVVGLMLNAQVYDRDIIGAPYINDDSTYTLRPDNPNRIAVYRSVDSQFILRDLYAKLRYQYGQAE